VDSSLEGIDYIDVDFILSATGRRPNLASMGLDQKQADLLGLTLTDQGALVVNENYQTSQAHIFAVGDVINRIQLTPVALAEAMRVVEWLNGTPLPQLEYNLVATAVFSQPSVGVIGLTEEQAQEQKIPITVYETNFRALFDGVLDHLNRVYFKLIVHKETDRVLGCHMVGPEAGEMIQGLAIAIQAKATKADFDRTIGIHPSMAEEWVTLRTPRKS
jgi:glutathione reductase (NADPH)